MIGKKIKHLILLISLARGIPIHVFFFFTLVFVLFFICCTTRNTYVDKLSWVQDDDNSAALPLLVNWPAEKNLSAHISEFKYIPLETNTASLFGKPLRIEVYKNKIYAWDYLVGQGVFIFDMNGAFIAKAGKKGNGPGEIVSADAMRIDPYNDYLIIVDDMQNKLVYYSLLGEYQKEVPLAVNTLGDFVCIDKNCLAFVHNEAAHNVFPGKLERYRIVCTDTLGNLLGGMFDKDDVVKACIASTQFFSNGNTTYFNPMFTSDIYLVGDSTIKKKYYCDYSLLNVSNPELPANEDDIKGVGRYLGGKISLNGIFVESDSAIAFQTRYRGADYITFYHKSTGKITSVPSLPSYAVDDSCLVDFTRLSQSGDYFVGYIDASFLKQWKELRVETYNECPYEDMIDALEEDDNIVLVFFKIK